MNRSNSPVFLGRRITIITLRNYILDVGLTDADTIVMHQADFDELALEHKQTYNEQLPLPYLLIKVLIREASQESVRQGNIIIIKNDTESIREKPVEQLDPDRIIYRCGYCGNLVNENGEELEPDEFRRNAAYLDKFGSEVTVHHKEGYCCEQEYDRDEETIQVSRPNINYSIVEDKALMDLTEADFTELGLDKVSTPDFNIIYACSDSSSVKIYFTPNQDSYSLRGHMLKEHEKIVTTDQLIRAIRTWRKD